MRNIDTSALGGKKIKFTELLGRIQEYMPNAYKELMSSISDSSQRKFEMTSRIKKFIMENRYYVEGLSSSDLIEKLYNEMALYSFLTPYLNFSIKDIEGIEIDSWDSVKIKHVGGELEYSDKHFFSPQHANDILKRILNQSSITMDNSNPLARGHLGDKTRITVIGGDGGIIDKDVGIAVSIRFVNPNNLTRENILDFGTATPEMLDFLCTAYRYGASMMLAGETDAGKTTLMSIIMRVSVPNDKKLITIENGTREFNNIKRDGNGKVINSVIHLVTRDSTKKETSITQQMLLEQSMTMNPDYLCMAEVKGSEAFETIEASLTGHPVIGTTHTGCCREIPDRLVQLASYRNSNLSDATLYSLAVKAFPILFYAQKGADGVRRITEICECWLENGKPQFQTLWEYQATENFFENGKTVINGHFKKVHTISESLQSKLRRKGIPEKELLRFLTMEGDKNSESHRLSLAAHNDGRHPDSAADVAV